MPRSRPVVNFEQAGGLPRDRPVDRPDTQLELLLKLAHCGTLSMLTPDSFTVEHETATTTTELDALLLCTGDTCPDTLTNQVMIELGQSTEHVEQKLACCCGSVDALGQGNECSLASGSASGSSAVASIISPGCTADSKSGGVDAIIRLMLLTC